VPDADSISWPALVALMALGNGPEPSLSGIVHVREVEPDEDHADAEVAGVGPVRITDDQHQVAKRGRLVRRQRLDGRPMAIFGEDTKWIWLNDDELPTVFRGLAIWGWDDHWVVQRRPLKRWGEGDDFTHPTGPVHSTTMLGRAAWSVELAPPPHKPFPLTLVVDAETGIVLQERNDGFGSVTEWVEISFGAELPDDLFVWTGDALEASDGRAEHEREIARRRAWLVAQGIGTPSLTVDPEFTPHRWDDTTGEFEASLNYDLSASVLRRRRSDTVWDTRNNWPHQYRWSDDKWDWYVGASAELRPDDLSKLRTQLQSPPSGT
jgi:hypothetical protein